MSNICKPTRVELPRIRQMRLASTNTLAYSAITTKAKKTDRNTVKLTDREKNRCICSWRDGQTDRWRDRQKDRMTGT